MKIELYLIFQVYRAIFMGVNTPYFSYGALTTWSEAAFDLHTFQPVANGQVKLY